MCLSELFVQSLADEYLLFSFYESYTGAAAAVEPVRDIAPIDAIERPHCGLQFCDKASVDCRLSACVTFKGVSFGTVRSYMAGRQQTEHNPGYKLPDQPGHLLPLQRERLADGPRFGSRCRRDKPWPVHKLHWRRGFPSQAILSFVRGPFASPCGQTA